MKTLTELADAAGISCGWDLDQAVPVLSEALASAPEEYRESVYSEGLRSILRNRRTADRTRLLADAAPRLSLVTEDDGQAARLQASVRSNLYGYATSDGGRPLGQCTRLQVLAQADLHAKIADKNRRLELWFRRVAALMSATGIVQDEISAERLASLLTEQSEELAA